VKTNIKTLLMVATVFALTACGGGGGGGSGSNNPGTGPGDPGGTPSAMTWIAIPPGSVNDTTSTFGTSGIYAITYGGGKFVAGGTVGKIAYSADGVKWTALLSNLFGIGTSAVNAIAYGNGVFVAVGWIVGGDGRMAYSANGINWTNIPPGTDNSVSTTFGTGYNSFIRNVAFGDGKFVAVGHNGKMAYSADGTHWTAIPSGTGPGKSGFSADGIIMNIGYGNGTFVAVGSGMTYSTDGGMNWTTIPVGSANNTTTTFGLSAINDVIYGNGKFIAVGHDAKMAYSANGVNWTAIPPGNTNGTTTSFGTYYNSDIGKTLGTPIFSLAFSDNRFVAGGYVGKMAYSANGINWYAIPPGTGSGASTFELDGGSAINSIAYGNGKFVAVGYEARMAYSIYP
jgi:hypothetical protein